MMISAMGQMAMLRDEGGRMKRRGMWILLWCLLSQASSAWATAYSCLGTVEQLTTDPSGTVNVSFAFQTGNMAWQDLCNVNTVANNVPVTACKSMLATLLLAKASQRQVEMWFDNSSTGCTAVPWKSIREMGWYWGPSIK